MTKCKDDSCARLSTTDAGYCDECYVKYYPDPNGQIGWVCPKCGRINSPYITQCNCTGYYPYPITFPWYPYMPPYHITCGYPMYKFPPTYTNDNI